MSDRKLELGEIQGNVLRGFNTKFEVLIALTANGAASFKSGVEWLASLADAVTVASDVQAERALMKFNATDAQATWLCVAVGHRFLKAARPDVLILDDAFNRGMVNRAPSVLGDKTDPKEWAVGGVEAPVDVFLIIGSNDKNAAETRADSSVAEAQAAGLAKTYRETAQRLDGREHFGFRDGISQPTIIGSDSVGTLGAGHFVFGYPKSPGLAPFAPVVDNESVTDNGSLVVFRRLKQDVRAFREFCEKETARLRPQWPGLMASHLAALLVGRWPSGALVRADQNEDPEGEPPDNAFDFRKDSDGASCPLGAHIRKVNPRKGNMDVRDPPRILRRGIPFGKPFDAAPDEDDRGLAFIAFQSSIKRQFEFLTQNWMNSPLNPGRGNDLLVGLGAGRRAMTIVSPDGQPIEVVGPQSPWITSTGGAYLFALSRSGLRKLGTPPPAMALWKPQQFLAMAAHRVRTMFE